MHIGRGSGPPNKGMARQQAQRTLPFASGLNAQDRMPGASQAIIRLCSFLLRTAARWDHGLAAQHAATHPFRQPGYSPRPYDWRALSLYLARGQRTACRFLGPGLLSDYPSQRAAADSGCNKKRR